MSDPILKWLNQENPLSKKITNIEQDFSNGKFFAELLTKFNQRVNINALNNKDLPTDKAANLKLLEPHFKNLNIKLDSKSIDSISKSERGAALKILYQLKIISAHRNEGKEGINSESPEKTQGMNQTKQANPLLGSTIRSKTGHEFNKSQFNQSLASKHYTEYETRMQRFEMTKTMNEDKAKREIEEMQRRYQEVKEQARLSQMDKLRMNKQYLKELDEKGWKDWKKNEDVLLQRLKKEKDFEDRMTMKMRKKVLDEEEFERTDQAEGIQGFELNAQKMGVELEHEPEEVRIVEKGGITTNALLIKLKEQSDMNEKARREKEKRLRKIKVDQDKAQIEIEGKKRDEALIDKFLLNSRKEGQACYERWRVEQGKKLVTENRRAKEEAYKEKKGQEIVKAQQEREAAVPKKTEEDLRQARLKKLQQRETRLEQRAEKRERHSMICTHVFNQILELVEMCYNQQQGHENIVLDAKYWREVSGMFAEDQIQVPKKRVGRLDGSQVLGKSVVEAQQNMERFIFNELEGYLNGHGTWRPFHKTKGKASIVLPDEPMIPEKPKNNDDLGLIVQNIIDMKYPPRELPKPSADIPNYLPLRIMAMGYPFSGRKTIGAFLKQKYDIVVLKIEDIIKESIDLNVPPPVEDPKKTKKPAPKGKEVEVPKPENEELKKIGLIVKEIQERGEAIPTGVYIDAFRAKIKELFPPLSEDQLVDELKKHKQKEEERVIELQKLQEKEEAKKKKAPAGKKDAAKEEPEGPAPIQKRPYYTRGWMLIGFPNNEEQAKEFEEVISGYVLDEELLNQEAEEKKRRAGVIVKAPEKPPAKSSFIEGGLDFVIKLEVTPEECVRRAAGRRVDPNTGNIYHMETNPPPANDAKLRDRLVPVNDPETTEEKINEKIEDFVGEEERLEVWYQRFGNEGAQIECLQRIDGLGKVEDVQARIEKQVEDLLEYKMREKYDRFLEEVEIKKQTERIQAAELAAKQLAAKEESKEAGEVQKTEQSEQQEESKEALDEEQERLSPELEMIPTARTDYNIRREILELVYSFWENIQESYIGVAKEVFNNLNEQKDFLHSKFAEIQVRFLEILRRQVDKLAFLKKFSERYNRFVDENPDILQDSVTRNELNAKIEELQDNLWKVLEGKKDEAIKERQAIMESGFIEEEMKFFVTNIQKMMQGELERYYGCVKLIKDYYQSIQSKAFSESQARTEFEILPSSDNLPPLENSTDPDSFPRLETIYQNALRILAGEEIMSNSIRRGSSVFAVGKSSAQTKDKVQVTETTNRSDKKSLQYLDKEATEVLYREKAIIKYRLFVLYTIGISKMKELRNMGKALYNKLDDWIIYSIKSENDTLYEQSKMIQSLVSKGERLPNLVANFPEVSNTHKALNYLDPLPIILPKSEAVLLNRFTLTQLTGLIEELNFLQDENGNIKVETLQQFFTRRFLSPISREDFPSEWIMYGMKSCMTFLQGLDTTSSGQVAWKYLATLLCVLSAPVPTEDELEEYIQALLGRSADGFIEQEAFTRCPSFFDNHDFVSQNLPNHPVFERDYLLKNVLFNIHKEFDQDVMEVGPFVALVAELKPANFIVEIPEETNSEKGSRNTSRKARALRKTYMNAHFSS